MKMPKKLQQFHEIAFSLTHGERRTTADVSCPYCGQQTLDYSFTVRKLPNKFGFFLICTNCHHRLHLSFDARPPNFRDDQVKPHYQKLEDEVRNGTPNLL